MRIKSAILAEGGRFVLKNAEWAERVEEEKANLSG
jgi:hypothetical protein